MLSTQVESGNSEPRWSHSLWLRASVLAALGVVLVAPWLIILAGQLGFDQRGAAGKVAEQFLEAVRTGNENDIRSLANLRPGLMPLLLPGMPIGLRLVHSDIESVAVQEKTATAQFTLSTALFAPPQELGAGLKPEQLAALAAAQFMGKRGMLLLRQQEQDWKVYGIIFPLNEQGTGPRYIWDGPVPPGREPKSPQQRQFEELAARDFEAWDRSWRIDLDARNLNAQTALTRLGGSQFRLRFDRLPEPERLVGLQLQKMSRFEAIEAVCRQLGGWPDYTRTFVQFKPGTRPFPVAFAGPFLLTAGEVKESSPHATGVLPLRCLAVDLPAEIAPYLEQGAWLGKIHEVVTREGRSLHHALNQSLFDPRRIPPALAGDSSEVAWNVPLKNLVRDLDELHRVRGSVAIPWPAKVELVRFETLTPGTARQVGETRLVLRSIEEVAPSLKKLIFDLTGIGTRRLSAAAFDVTGRCLWAGSIEPPGPDWVWISVQGEPASVVFKTITIQEVRYPFELNNIPLRRSPRELTAPRFGDAAPVTVRFQKLGSELKPKPFAGVQCRFENPTPRDVERLDLRLAYQDENGKVIKTVERTIATLDDTTGRLRVIASGETVNVPDKALPPETRTAEVTVLRVGFADGFTWPP